MGDWNEDSVEDSEVEDEAEEGSEDGTAQQHARLEKFAPPETEPLPDDIQRLIDHERENAPEDEQVVSGGFHALRPSWEKLHPIVVLPSHKSASVHGGIYKGRSSDWRWLPNTGPNTSCVRRGKTLPLMDALTRQWPGEAMLITYIMRHRESGRFLECTPRVAKDSIEWLAEIGIDVWCTMHAVDIDNPGHRAWTDEDLRNFERLKRECPSLQTSITYKTEHGWRCLNPYAEPVPVSVAEQVILARLDQMQREGIDVDYKCKDWTHVFRLPKTYRVNKRTGARTLSAYELENDTFTPIDPYDPALYRYTSLPGTGPAREAERADGKTVAVDVPGPGATDAAMARPRAQAQFKAKASKPRRASVLTYEKDPLKIPLQYSILIELVADAIGKKVSSGYHHLYLCLAGALLQKAMVSPQYVPVMVRVIAQRAETIWREGRPEDAARWAGHSWADEHEGSARDTCERWAADERVSAYGALNRDYPAVAIELHYGTNRAAKRRESAPADTKVLSAKEAREELFIRIMGAGDHDGTMIVVAGCGAGKTHAAERAAWARARGTHEKERAPRGSKTAISVDKNRLAIQVCNSLENAFGEPWLRYRSPASVLDKNKRPVCKFHEQARLLQRGGHSVHYELCEGRGKTPCEYRGTCSAYGAFEGDEMARVAVGNHALIRPLMRFAGTTGLVVLDELQSPVETRTFSLSQVVRTLEKGHLYYDSYFYCMKPAVYALAKYIANAELTEESDRVPKAMPLEGALLWGADHVPDEDVGYACAAARVPRTTNTEVLLPCVRNALPEDAKSDAPPVRPVEMNMAKRNAARSRELGEASEVLRLLYDAVKRLDSGDYRTLRQVIRVEEQTVGGVTDRVACITGVRKQTVDILRTPGPRVITDANADLYVELLKRAVYEPDRPYRPNVYRVEAADAVRVDRYLAPVAYSSRSGWLSGEKVAWKEFKATLRRSIAFVRDPNVCGFLNKDASARTLFVVTYKRIELAMRAVRTPTDATRDNWLGAGGSQEELDEAAREIGPILKLWTGDLVIGYFQGLRGMDEGERADTLITLGDPWINLGEVRSQVAFMNSFTDATDERGRPIPPLDVPSRSLAIARAELEQAHGRIRAASRPGPALALHVGRVLPGGPGWADAVELKVSPGRQPNEPSMTKDEFCQIRLEMNLTQDQVAKHLCISSRMVRMYEKGDVAIKPAVASILRELQGER